MKVVENEDMRIKAEAYAELINDMQAKIYEYENENPTCMNDAIRNINKKLSAARMEARIYIDEEHFNKWDELLLSANAAMIRSKTFR